MKEFNVKSISLIYFLIKLMKHAVNNVSNSCKRDFDFMSLMKNLLKSLHIYIVSIILYPHIWLPQFSNITLFSSAAPPLLSPRKSSQFRTFPFVKANSLWVGVQAEHVRRRERGRHRLRRGGGGRKVSESVSHVRSWDHRHASGDVTSAMAACFC